MIESIDLKPGDELSKRSLAVPSDTWFIDTFGTEWQKMPLNSNFSVERIDDHQPEYGGIVVQLAPVPKDGRVFLFPPSFLTSDHFRLLPKMHGQQEIKFQAPDFSRLR